MHVVIADGRHVRAKLAAATLMAFLLLAGALVPVTMSAHTTSEGQQVRTAPRKLVRAAPPPDDSFGGTAAHRRLASYPACLPLPLSPCCRRTRSIS